MISKWIELKPKAIVLRKQGLSIKKINKKLFIPISTLSGWLKNVLLTQKQRDKLKNDDKIALIKARKKAVVWHNTQKRHRLELAEQQALEIIDQRTAGKPTYPHYKGVCIINCGNVAIQRKLVYLSRMFCERIVDPMRG